MYLRGLAVSVSFCLFSSSFYLSFCDSLLVPFFLRVCIRASEFVNDVFVYVLMCTIFPIRSSVFIPPSSLFNFARLWQLSTSRVQISIVDIYLDLGQYICKYTHVCIYICIYVYMYMYIYICIFG